MCHAPRSCNAMLSAAGWGVLAHGALKGAGVSHARVSTQKVISPTTLRLAVLNCLGLQSRGGSDTSGPFVTLTSSLQCRVGHSWLSAATSVCSPAFPGLQFLNRQCRQVSRQLFQRQTATLFAARLGLRLEATGKLPWLWDVSSFFIG